MSQDKILKAKTLRDLESGKLKEIYKAALTADTNREKKDIFEVLFLDTDDIKQEFCKQHTCLINLIFNDVDEVKLATTQMHEFNKIFAETKAIYNKLFSSSSSRQSLTPNTANPINPHHINLPKLEIIKFNGDIKTFPAFYDLFENLIHLNSTLSSIEKFTYLISYLEGPPLNMVKCLPLSAANYTIAYESLVKRYNNKRLLAQAHWSSIENAPSVNCDDPIALRNLLDIFSKNLKALNTLNLTTDNWDFILSHMLLKRIDSDTITRFEVTQGKQGEIPTYTAVFNFLENHCNALFTVNSFSSKPSFKNKVNKSNETNMQNSSKKSFLTKTQDTFSPNTRNNYGPEQLKCLYCNQNHLIYKCSAFNNLSIEDRFNVAKSKNLCINCLSSVHKTAKCQSTTSCRVCNKRHHSLLHFTKSNGDAPTPGVNVADPTYPRVLENSANTALSSLANTSSVLATVIVKIMDSQGFYHPVRALLDTGSQVSFITQKRANQLNLSRKRINSDIQGIGQTNFNSQLGCVNINISSDDQNGPCLEGHALVLTQICSALPSSPICPDKYEHLKNIKLADPQWFKPSQIDLLLGVDFIPYIMQAGKILGSLNEPSAFNTIFGYVIMGQCNTLTQTYTSFFCQGNCSDIDNTLRKFWELENVPDKPISSPDDVLCEKIFSETVQRDNEGRYVVNLPFYDAEPVFPSSRDIALKRFLSLEKRLLNTPELYNKYSDFLKEYLDLNHMELIVKPDNSPRSFYIPHHAVERPESLSTKLRVVFNASAKTGSNLSLNDTLLTGPKLQQDISSILLNFRLHKVVLSADISKMYRQILISSEHQDFQRIFYRFNPNEPISEFRLKTVTYGTSCAPFLALRVLQHLAESQQSVFPKASKVILNDTYIDDICTGCESVDEARSLRDDLITVLKQGGFTLHKWASNHLDVLNDLPETLVNPVSLDWDQDNITKILGLRWQPQSDYFCFEVKPLNNPCTKRHILSELARVFDPLGYLTPITLLAKSLISKLWALGLDWNSEPPAEIQHIWNRYKSELSLLTTFKLPRHINIFSGKAIYDLCGFADASMRGYAAVIYIRVFYENQMKVYFLCSKSRVAPLKTISIPKLELCAAVLLAELTNFVIKTYSSRISFTNIYAWSDSTVALSWIKSHPSRWKTFVSNRVSSIQDKINPSNWYYISTCLNPADVASRGVFPSELLHHNLFYSGPDFLKLPIELWPNKIYTSTPEVWEEERKNVVLAAFPSQNPLILDIIINKFSSLITLQKVFAYVLKFIYALKTKYLKLPCKNDFTLTYKDLQAALLQLIKHVQSIAFVNEISKLKNKEILSKPFLKLNLFLDSENILRVGGRLHFSSLPYDKKYPILLPKTHRLTTLIIEHLHRKYMHAGLQSVLFLLTQNYWVISAKRAINTVLSKCVTCFRVKPKVATLPFMGNLPSPRISQIKCFSHAGVDLGGPYSITLGKTRGAKTFKAYICLFVCLATKALHLELVSELTADAFLSALRRFVARRGRCTDLYSDNATNFISANKKLLQIESEHPIQWHFIPPQSPHFGGLWEAGIKSVKKHLVRVLGAQVLTYEEFSTVLCQIEAILNSRPLTAVSSDPNDLSVLTPGHFLTLEPLTAVPDSDLTDIKLNRLTRWQLLQRLQQDFWKRWHHEYLHTLQQRGKWLEPSCNPAVGTLVLIKDDLLPPLQWRLGRIILLHPGKDGIARVATIRTSTNTFKRSLAKLCPLPIYSSQDA